MIRSMTAFARNESKWICGTYIWEIRSLNQRYLEIILNIPEKYIDIEQKIRKCIKNSYINRGKIECNLFININYNYKNNYFFNKKLAKEIIYFSKFIKNKINCRNIDPIDILQWPGVLKLEENKIDNIINKLITSFEITLNDFIKSREKEGENIKLIIEKNLFYLIEEIIKIRKKIPEIIIKQREKIKSKLIEAEIILDLNRIEQDIILLAQKVDVTEELDRLEIHIKEIYNILNLNKPSGRRLDFIMQELNRESNTLSSKSINSNVTISVIEIKVLIEQMREQIQNIE